jgi:hypothetical protein
MDSANATTSLRSHFISFADVHGLKFWPCHQLHAGAEGGGVERGQLPPSPPKNFPYS